ncbi:MAG TPA: hypothetical protein VFN57_06505 [Thermomicrobiaceae bacterium]|nr:hypothetical protein [Thermomicrobiaceae bacterium]
MPLHIVSFDLLRKGRAPGPWRELAAGYDVSAVWLVDDWQLPSSYHHPAGHAIYVNTRGAAWYRDALERGVRRYTEAVTLWFLHELGHAARGHRGVDPRSLRLGDDDPREVQAWHFALAFRASRPAECCALEEAYASWYRGYRHRRKNWPDDLDEAVAHGWPQHPYRAWPALPDLAGHNPTLTTGS